MDKRAITGTCPECEEKDRVQTAMTMTITKMAGTICWYVVYITCDRGHQWVAGHDMKFTTRA